ncbi:MAG: hypothetical protein ACAH83_01860 [Alphaproteobacteria bacterium]
MSEGFHGKSIEEIVDIKCKLYYARQDQERKDREAREKALAENKADVTAPKAEEPKHANVSFIQKWKHKLHLD